MFEHATARSFEPYLDHVIHTRLGEREIALRLVEVRTQSEAWSRPVATTAGDRAIPPRRSFSLIFTGPLEPVLPDGTYTFSHPELASFELFVSPYSQEGDTTFYESAFT